MDKNLPDREVSAARRLERSRGSEEPEARKSGVTVSLRKARSQLERVCQMLMLPSPAVLDGCENVLASAAAEMEASRPGWHEAAGDRLAAEEARLTRRALKQAQRLLENAANFHARWQRMRAAMTGGYQADGTPGQLRRPGRIFVKG